MFAGIAGVLEVQGRVSGTPRRVSLIPIEVDGSWYLMSFGGVTDWVRNLRAACHGELRRKGRAQRFRAIDVDGHERDRVIARYLGRMGPLRRDFDRRPNAADHPVFRAEPIGYRVPVATPR